MSQWHLVMRCQRLYLRWRIRSDEIFLLKAAMLKARGEGLRLNLEGDEVLYPNGVDLTRGEIVLPRAADDSVEIGPLVAFVVDWHPKIARRWLENRERLAALDSGVECQG